MSAGSLRERVAEAIREHAPDEGDCICSEYVLDVPHAAHLADAVLAVVRKWLGSVDAITGVAEAMACKDWCREPAYTCMGARNRGAQAILAALIDQTKED